MFSYTIYIDLLYILLFPFQAALFKLLSLKCISSSSGSGNDDLYFILEGSKVPNDPDTTHRFDINEGSTLQLSTSSNVFLQDGSTLTGDSFVKSKSTGNMEVQLWDYDWASSDDLLGSVVLFSATNGTFRESFNGEGSNYELVYQVVTM